MLKGKTVIELTDVHTGKKEHYEDTNLVTEAAMDVLNCNIKGMLYNGTTFNGSTGDDCGCRLRKTSWAASFYTRMHLRSVQTLSMLRWIIR